MDSVLFQRMVVSRKVLVRTQNSESQGPRQILSTFLVPGKVRSWGLPNKLSGSQKIQVTNESLSVPDFFKKEKCGRETPLSKWVGGSPSFLMGLFHSHGDTPSGYEVGL